MVTHRNAWMNSIGTLVHHPMSVGERYLWTLPMFHANGWTFVWTVTAVGGTHVCLSKVDAGAIYGLVDREQVTMLCAAPTVLIGIANGPSAQRSAMRRGACSPPGAAGVGDDRAHRGRAWLGGHPRLRAHRDCAVHPVRAAAQVRRGCRRTGDRQGAPGVELISPGAAVVDESGRRCRAMRPRSGRSSCAATWS
jgi:fatty-acyl-CoA synthase